MLRESGRPTFSHSQRSCILVVLHFLHAPSSKRAIKYCRSSCLFAQSAQLFVYVDKSLPERSRAARTVRSACVVCARRRSDSRPAQRTAGMDVYFRPTRRRLQRTSQPGRKSGKFTSADVIAFISCERAARAGTRERGVGWASSRLPAPR